MKRYRIEYRDEDPGCPVFASTVRAHDRHDAEERFLYGSAFGDDGDGWIVLKITEIKGE